MRRRSLFVLALLVAALAGCGVATSDTDDGRDEREPYTPDCSITCAIDGRCVAARACECVVWEGCTLGGEPVADDDCCTALHQASCASSQNCATWGLCSLGPGYCIAGSDAECAASEFCSIMGWCTDCGDSCGPEGC